MALTPDDVVNKQFQHVRFKEGFDPDEVDDFLDEVVGEWNKTLKENEALKARIAELEAGLADAPAAAPAVAAPVAEPKVSADVQSQGATASAGIIELAQRLHDEHIAEAKAQREKMLTEAQAQATKIVADAQEAGREETSRITSEITKLEARVSELRTFERDYRAKLRSYIEGQLKDLDQAGSAAGKNVPVSAVGL